MNSREIILNQIRKNKPAQPVAPEIFDHEVIASMESLMESFISKLEKSGAVVTLINKKELKNQVDSYAALKNMVIQVPVLNHFENRITATSNRDQLDKIETAILEAQIGVAENGAIWIDETALPHRAVAFITQDLVLVLSGESLVANMHEAYKVIDIAATGYGLFIAGPSKTADIEQSLVIGAHGAKSLRVFIYS